MATLKGGDNSWEEGLRHRELLSLPTPKCGPRSAATGAHPSRFPGSKLTRLTMALAALVQGPKLGNSFWIGPKRASSSTSQII
jgi:hypothetical protein